MERNYSIDFIKFFAIFAVVAIHTGTFRGVFIGDINGDDIDFVIDILARFAVPFFFISSGYLFLQKMKSIFEKNAVDVMKMQLAYFRKYVLKLMKLWAAWFVFYFLFDLIVKFIETEKNFEALTAMVLDYVSTIFTLDLLFYGGGYSQYHLWFLLALIWSVVVLFVSYKLNVLPLLFIVSLGLNIFGLFGQSYSFFYEVSLNTRDALFFGLFYTTLGAVLGMYAQKITAMANKVSSVLLVTMIGLFALLQVIEAFITVRIFEGNGQEYFLTTIPLTLVLFITIMKHKTIGKKSLLSQIGAQAVGIYVSHVFIKKVIPIVMTRLELTYLEETVWWKLLFTPIVFILAYLMYTGIQYLKNRISRKSVFPVKGKLNFKSERQFTH